MTNKPLHSYILTFIATYGESALQEAMQQYIDSQQIYMTIKQNHVQGTGEPAD